VGVVPVQLLMCQCCMFAMCCADGVEALEVVAPGGYKFLVANADTQGTVMTELCLSSSGLEKSLGRWLHGAGMSCTRVTAMHIVEERLVSHTGCWKT
jgi:hypothetical protein